MHFCCTSEDINNISYSLLMKDGKEQMVLEMKEIIEKLIKMSEKYCECSMLSRTHGQVASTTTLGKEMGNYAYRLNEQFIKIESL